MSRPDVEQLLESVDLLEVEIPEGLADRVWSEIRPIVEGSRRIQSINDANVSSASEVVPLRHAQEGPPTAWRLRWRLSLVAAAVFIVAGFLVATAGPTEEVETVSSSLQSAPESCAVLNTELAALLEEQQFNDLPTSSIETLDAEKITSLAAAFDRFLDTTSPVGLSEQFRQMQIIRRGLLVAAAQRQNGDDEAANQTVQHLIGILNNDNQWHVEGPLAGCFDQ